MGRFSRAALTPGLSRGALTAALQAEFDFHSNAENTLDAEANYVLLQMFGVGRLNGCRLAISSSKVLRMTNGWFIAGCGLAVTDPLDPLYFMGAKLAWVNGGAGYIEFLGSNAPPLSQASGVYGYMAVRISGGVATYDIQWSASLLTPSTNIGNRWLIGKVVTDAVGVTSVDDSMADIIYSVAQLAAQVQTLSDLVATLTGGGGPGTPLNAHTIPWDATVGAPTIQEYVDAADAADKAYSDSLNANKGVIPMVLPTDIESNNQARLAIMVAEINPTGLERLEIAAIDVNRWGDGTGGSPNFDNGGTLPGDPVSGGYAPT